MTVGSRNRVGGVAVVLALVALLAAGCGERAEPTGTNVDLYPVTVQDSAGVGPVSLAAAPGRVAVLDQEGVRILRALGVRATLAADPNGNPKRTLLAGLHPGLVVAGPSNAPLQLRRLHDKVPAPIYIAGGDSIAAVKRSILELGLLTGTPVRARQLVAAIAAAQAKVAPAGNGAAAPTVFVDLGFFATTGEHSLIGELLRAVGARNVIGANADPSLVDAAGLAKLDPQIYLASSDSGTTLAMLRKDPLLRDVAAVRSGRFAIVPAALLQPGPQIGESLVQLSKAIHASSS
jgi:ABC-type Fe3+-hydroxamate transport system substrate-binding protein